MWLQSVYRLVAVRLIMRFTYIVDEKVSGRYVIMKKDYKVAVAGTGARDIIWTTREKPDFMRVCAA